METIHFEHQEGMLCAQHALNALLQAPYFTVFDLADVAKKLDEAEQGCMAQANNGIPLHNGVAGVSENMDDSGYFSVQVMSEALRGWGLILVPYMSNTDSAAIAARTEPTEQKAYVCNFEKHWFTVRRFGTQWFNLNSILACPELISETYLSLFLSQLQNDGYTIFVVKGDLPPATADEIISLQPVSLKEAKAFVEAHSAGKKKPGNTETSGKANTSVDREEVIDDEIAKAIALSREEMEGRDRSLQQVIGESGGIAPGDMDLQAALELSMRSQEETELEKALKLSLAGSEQEADASLGDQGSSSLAHSFPGSSTDPAVDNSQAQVRPSQGSYQTVNPEEIRARRAAFLDKFTGPQTDTGVDKNGETGR